MYRTPKLLKKYLEFVITAVLTEKSVVLKSISMKWAMNPKQIEKLVILQHIT